MTGRASDPAAPQTAPVITATGYSEAGLKAGLADPQVAARRRRFAFWGVAEHMVWLYWRYRATLLTSAIGEPVLYLLGMGLGLGVLVSQGSGTGIEGVNYVEFLAPALLVSAAIMVGVEESTYQILGGTQWESKRFFTIYQAAVSPGQLALGVLLAIQMRVMAVASIYMAVMLLFGVVPQPLLGLLMVPVAGLGALAFGAPVAGYFAGLEREGGRANLVRRFVLMPLVLFSGVYYPLTVLPQYIQWIGWISPVWHSSQLARSLSFGLDEPLWLTLVHVLYLLALAAAGALWLVRSLTRKLGAS